VPGYHYARVCRPVLVAFRFVRARCLVRAFRSARVRRLVLVAFRFVRVRCLVRAFRSARACLVPAAFRPALARYLVRAHHPGLAYRPAGGRCSARGRRSRAALAALAVEL
jgi:hypothetical protein